MSALTENNAPEGKTMATQITRYRADDGREFETLAEAQHHERVSGLAMALDEFQEHFPEDGYDSLRAAEWLFKTYTMERRP